MVASAGQLEPESAAFLDRLRSASRAVPSASPEHNDLEGKRKSMAALIEACGPRKLPVQEVRRRLIVAEGREIPVQICLPESGRGAAQSGPRPLVLYFHGGGWTHFSAATHEGVARYLCNKADCIVVNVDYRLSPEHQFPAALEDTYEALRWVSSNADSLGGDARAIAVTGESARRYSQRGTLFARPEPGWATDRPANPDVPVTHPARL